LVAALVAAQGESLRNLVLDAGAIAAVLAVPIIAGLSGLSRSGRAAMTAIIVQGTVLAVCDWWLGVEGAFLWMLASGIAAFAAVALADRRPLPAAARS
jgi:fructose-specific phosphotransferase system IIC component